MTVQECLECSLVFPAHLPKCPECGWDKVPPAPVVPHRTSTEPSIWLPKHKGDIEFNRKAMQAAGVAGDTIACLFRMFGKRDED